MKLNQQLEQRVADQVGEIERMSRLRRFLPPQMADLIVASGSEKQLESHNTRGHVLRYESAEALNSVRDTLLIGGDNLAEVFRVHARCQSR